jgi:hypothetical protein
MRRFAAPQLEADVIDCHTTPPGFESGGEILNS